jgi:SlyX protein
MSEAESRLIDLETRLAYQEDLLLSLNDVVSRQQFEIDHLKARLSLLVEHLQRLGALSDLPEANIIERPPHY